VRTRFLVLGEVGRTMHPLTVIYLEHDGKVLLVDGAGEGPLKPEPGRLENDRLLRFPTHDETASMGIAYTEKGRIRVAFGSTEVEVVKGYPDLAWPKNWAWKDACIADNAVHPVAREAIYRSLHRLVSKVMIQNKAGEVLMGRVERGHFRGSWTLPGGYMDHNEHPATGCVRETKEELGLSIELDRAEPVITQRVFNEEGVSFVSFTYKATWNGGLDELTLQTEEISEAKWFSVQEAYACAVSQFDREGLRTLL